MKPEIDIYISHFIDIENDSSSYQNWIENIKVYIKWQLKKILKKDVNIITSFDLTQTEDISLNDALKHSKCLLVVLSPEFANSIQYQNEIQLIINQKNLAAETKENVFKVYKAPIQLKDIPKELHRSFGYNLFYQNTETNEVIEFEEFHGEEEENIFWFKIVDLCYDLSYQLSGFNSQEQIPPKNVYIAEVSKDQRFHRDMIKRDFLMKGYNVYPKEHLPTNSLNELEDKILEFLNQCSYSIHIIGDEPGRTVGNTELNVVDFQNQVAAKYIHRITKEANEGFHRFIWIPPNLKLYNPKQLIRIDNLKRNTKEIENAEIVETPLEVFRSLIRNRMDKSKVKGGQLKARKKTSKNVYKLYIIFEYKERDNKSIKEIIDIVEAENIYINKPEFGDDQRILITTHKQMLVESDSILIFYNNSGSQWLSSKIHDIIKAPGFGRTKPFIGNFVFINNDENNIVRNLKSKLNGLDIFYNVEKNTIKNKLPVYLKSLINSKNG